MKKSIAVLLLAVMMLSLAACGNTQTTTTSGVATEPATQGGGTTPVTSGDVRTGLAIVTSAAKSRDAAVDAAGLAQSDATVVGVLVDADGRILNCVIEAVQVQVNFDAAGKVTTDLATVFGTKTDAGEAYGMKAVSSIGKEWYEQVQALGAYCVGKTVDEIKGIAVNADGVPTGDDLKSSVTIKISGYVSALEQAVQTAQPLGAGAGDTLGIGAQATIKGSKDAGESDGLVEVYAYYALASFSGETVTSAVLDSAQTRISFDKAGKLTSDVTAAVLTKLELGESYGMKGVSGIGKEWNEQALAYAQYVTGKTITEIEGIALTETGAPSGDDIKTSVTIGVKSLHEVLNKAYRYSTTVYQ